MGIGIQICGLNGSGKSTLGKMLAQELGFHFIDNENLFYSRTKNDEPYTDPRSREEVEALLLQEVRQHPNFVFAAVKGDYGNEIISLYDYIVVLEVPRAIRMQRVRARSYQKFGSRMLEGGDLHDEEEAFFRMVEERPDDLVDRWLQSLPCSILRVDGNRPVKENVESICRWIGADRGSTNL